MRTVPVAKYMEITLGENICKLIKEIYFLDVDWPLCYRQVSQKFTDFKKILRKFYGFPDWTYNEQLLGMLKDYTKKDILEVFSMEKELLGQELLPNRAKNGNPKYGENVKWVPVPVDNPELLTKVNKLLKSARDDKEIINAEIVH